MHGNSGSGGTPNLNNPSRVPDAMEVSHTFGGLSGAVQPTGFMDILSDIPTPTPTPGHQGNALRQWYEDQDGPWIPPISSKPSSLAYSGSAAQSRSLLVGGSRNIGAGLGPGPLPASFAHFQPTAPSECSTVHTGVPASDSGYVSAHGHSLRGDPSVYSDIDRSADTRSLVGHLNDFRFHMNTASVLNSVDPGRHSQQHRRIPPWNSAGDLASSVPTPHAVNHEASHLVCQDCRHPCKTPSELKKHKARHTKPHVCAEPSCGRTKGFSSANDLERHKRSRHPDSDAAGPRFRCNIGPCRSKNKLWPRADNFRQHLKRVHKELSLDVDLERFVDRGSVHSSNDLAVLGSTDQGHLDLMSDVGTDPGVANSHWARTTAGARSAILESSSSLPDTSRVSRMGGNFGEDPNLMVGTQFAAFSPASDSRGRDVTLRDRSRSPVAARLGLNHVEPVRLDSSPAESIGAGSPMPTDDQPVPHGSHGGQDQCIQPDVLSYKRPAPVVTAPEAAPNIIRPTEFQQTTNQGADENLLDAGLCQSQDDDSMSNDGLGDDDEMGGTGPNDDREDGLQSPEGSQENPVDVEMSPPQSETPLMDIDIVAPKAEAHSPDSTKEDTDKQQLDASSSAAPSGSSNPALESSAMDEDEDELDEETAKATAWLKTFQEFQEKKGVLEKIVGKNKDVLEKFVESLGLGYMKPNLSAATAASAGANKQPQQHSQGQSQGSNSSAALEAPAATTGGGHSVGRTPCPECHKTFLRQCELKKHMKRHEKPYGCTFRQCSKSFGSKSDWKRHENSQHHKMEVWRCDDTSGCNSSTVQDEAAAAGDGAVNNDKTSAANDPSSTSLTLSPPSSSLPSICGRVCHHRETFRVHLQRDHNVLQEAIITEKLETCRIGRNCETSFWCGFCEAIIEINNNNNNNNNNNTATRDGTTAATAPGGGTTATGVATGSSGGGSGAWNLRYDHIEDHLFGRAGLPKMKHTQWKDDDLDVPPLPLPSTTTTMTTMSGEAAGALQSSESASPESEPNPQQQRSSSQEPAAAAATAATSSIAIEASALAPAAVAAVAASSSSPSSSEASRPSSSATSPEKSPSPSSSSLTPPANDTAITATMTTASPGSRSSSPEPRGKRPHAPGGDEQLRPRPKRPKVSKLMAWYCCQCTGQNMLYLTIDCMNSTSCTHTCCDDCPREELRPLEDQ